jgi:hypothetical protein
MKKILIVLALAGFSTAFAQETKNENEKKTTTITKTTVEDSKGVDVSTKAVTETENQKLALNNFDGTHNFNTVMQPREIKSDVNYSNDGVSYRFEPHTTNGFQLMSVGNNDVKPVEYAVLRPSSQKGYYIMSQDGQSSFGYFNQNGNFVVESYDAKNDVVVTTVYKLEMTEKKIEKKGKM